MKKSIFSLFAVVMCVCGAAGATIRVDPKERATVILIPEKCNYGIRYAAQELSYHIGKAAGVKIRTLRDGAELPANGFVISLGETGFAKKHGVSGAGLKHNCARILGDDDKLIITGNDRGDNLGALLVETSATLFAVYDILEKSNGVRWLYPGESGEIIPKSATFNFEGGDRVSRPRLRFFFWRQLWSSVNNWPSPGVGRNFMHQEMIWLLRHRSNRDLAEQHYPHGFEKWPQKYLKTHPEFFNLLPDGTRRSDPTYWGGQPHLISMDTSNRGFREQIVRDWIAGFDPKYPRINLKSNDTANKCVCDDCLAEDDSEIPASERKARAAAKFASGDRNWSRELGSTTERMVRFYKAVEAVADELAPEKKAKFSGLIYANFSEPPKNARLGDRWQLCFCPPMMFPFTPAKVANYKRLWEGWRNTGCDLVIRPNFTLDGHCYPINFAREFYDIYTFAEERGLTGSDYDSLTGMYGANPLTLYTIARLQNAPRGITFEEIENEFYSAYGPAAADVGRYFDRTAEISRRAGEQAQASGEEGGAWHSYYRVGHKLFTPEVFSELGAILQAAAAAASGDPAASIRVRNLRTGLENARLTALAAAAFDEYRKSGDYLEFAAALRNLDDFREAHAADLCFNLGYLYVRESGEWPRGAMKKLNRNTRALPLEWKFRTDPDQSGEKQGFTSPDHDDSAWETIRTDRPWEEQGHPGYDGWGWYRLSVDIPSDAPGSPVLIVGCADEAAQVWINGKKLLDRPYPYKGNANSWNESFEVPWQAVPGRNVIAVKVIDNHGNGGICKRCYLKFEKRIDRSRNLVKDPDFTDTASLWQFSSRIGRAEFRTLEFDGRSAAMLKVVSRDPSRRYLNQYGTHAMLHQRVPGLIPGKHYEVSVTFRTSGDFDGKMLVFLHSDLQTSRASGANIQLDDGGRKLRWITMSRNFVPKRDFASLYLNIAANTGALYFAEVSVTPVELKTASTPGNLLKNGGFSEAGAWAFHRRIGVAEVAYEPSGDRTAAVIRAVRPDPGKKFIGKYAVHALLHQSVSGLTPGRRYRVKVTYRTGDGFDGVMMVWAHGKKGGSGQNIQIDASPSGEWKTVERSFVAGRATADIYLNYGGNRGWIAFAEAAVIPEQIGK
ncbi:MAG: DUF4838 domain-containing protein [Lentisphaeria bacterium]|nr:DUF4838 domain-containing protein [Lentisphaeria bacterium]